MLYSVISDKLLSKHDAIVNNRIALAKLDKNSVSIDAFNQKAENLKNLVKDFNKSCMQEYFGMYNSCIDCLKDGFAPVCKLENDFSGVSFGESKKRISLSDIAKTYGIDNAYKEKVKELYNCFVSLVLQDISDGQTSIYNGIVTIASKNSVTKKLQSVVDLFVGADFESKVLKRDVNFILATLAKLAKENHGIEFIKQKQF